MQLDAIGNAGMNVYGEIWGFNALQDDVVPTILQRIPCLKDAKG